MILLVPFNLISALYIVSLFTIDKVDITMLSFTSFAFIKLAGRDTMLAILTDAMYTLPSSISTTGLELSFVISFIVTFSRYTLLSLLALIMLFGLA